MIGNLKGCHALAPNEEAKEKCDALVGSVYTMQCTLKHNNTTYNMFATGGSCVLAQWRQQPSW
jgi:hypothetical protein